jgi:hypothetical protein
MGNAVKAAVAALVLTLGGSACSSGDDGAKPSAAAVSGELRIDQLQLKATHNSYHLETPGTQVADWMYTSDPLDVQASDEGVRGFELDTHYDDGALDVHHIPQLDERTTCATLRDCLTVLRDWSDAHPGHHVLFLHIEPKDAEVGEKPDYAAYADALDAVLLEVWTRKRLVTPADVQGKEPTLRDAVKKHAWPTIESTRGKLLAYLDERGPFHEAYTRGGSDLHGRVVFPSSHVDEPIAAVVVANDPLAPATAAAVKQGFIVRTRADSTPTPDDLDTRRAMALASGAQIVTTDYPTDVAGKAQALDLPGGEPSRCNPVTAPKTCSALEVEDPAHLLPER